MKLHNTISGVLPTCQAPLNTSHGWTHLNLLPTPRRYESWLHITNNLQELATYFGKGIHSQGFWLCSHKVPAATTQLCPCSMRIAISNECGCVPIKLYLEKWWAKFGLSITIWPENIVPCTREKLCGPEWRDVFLLTMWPSPCLVPGWA